MKDWRFYGRRKEIDELQNGLELGTAQSTRHFHSLRVRGRRGVGKTHLLKQMKGYIPADVPFILYELPDPAMYSDGPPSPEAIIDGVKEVNNSLQLEAEKAGLQNFEAKLPIRTSLYHDRMWFKEVLATLLKAGAVVVLDEFHLARDLGLASYVKQVIDEAGGCQGIYKNPGKLVLMGSHQQKFDDLFRPDQPLYGRTGATIHVRPWRLETVMTMAAKQGIMADPRRFLTLWTAYGGMPRNWQRYCTAPEYKHLHEIENDREWRKTFLEVESKGLADPRERWDAKAWIELPDVQRAMLLWIGYNQPKGVKLNQIPKELGSHAEKLEFMNYLRTWLELVDLNRSVGEQSPGKWFITDPNTLFQISVFGGLGHIKDDQPAISITDPSRGKGDGLQYLGRMETLEGYALERLAAAWLAKQEGVTWSSSGVWHPQFEGDIDVMATSMGDGPKIVWLGSAKRRAESHSTEDIIKQQDQFMDNLIESVGNKKGEDAELLQGAFRKRLLFARSFSPDSRKIYEKEGFDVIDIHTMAKKLGIDPKSEPALGP